MRTRLGLDISQLFARSILAGQTFGKLEPYDNAYDAVSYTHLVSVTRCRWLPAAG